MFTVRSGLSLFDHLKSVFLNFNNVNIAQYLFRSYSTVHVCRCHTISVMFKRLMFISVIFLVIFKYFGHIHSVMLIRSNDLHLLYLQKVVSTVMSGVLFARFPTVDYITQM